MEFWVNIKAFEILILFSNSDFNVSCTWVSKKFFIILTLKIQQSFEILLLAVYNLLDIFIY
jgi:hypothetical protein